MMVFVRFSPKSSGAFEMKPMRSFSKEIWSFHFGNVCRIGTRLSESPILLNRRSL
jgi:hypothetical protein